MSKFEAHHRRYQDEHQEAHPAPRERDKDSTTYTFVLTPSELRELFNILSPSGVPTGEARASLFKTFDEQWSAQVPDDPL